MHKPCPSLGGQSEHFPFYSFGAVYSCHIIEYMPIFCQAQRRSSVAAGAAEGCGIGIGAEPCSPVPSHTTWQAVPHQAVGMVEVGKASVPALSPEVTQLGSAEPVPRCRCVSGFTFPHIVGELRFANI